MLKLRENREAILSAHDMGDLNDEKFIMLYDLNRSTNLDLPYWDYERFDLDRMSDDECIAEFWFNLVIEPLSLRDRSLTLKYGSRSWLRLSAMAF